MTLPNRFPLLMLLSFLVACSANPAFEEGKKLLEEGRTEDAVLRMEQGTRDVPGDVVARQQYYRQRELLLGRWLTLAEYARNAGQLDEAESLYLRVFRIDANNERAQGGVREIQNARRHIKRVNEAEVLLKKGELASAEQILRSVLSENPMHARARALQQQVREQDAKTQAPLLAIKGPFAKPITLEFRDTPLKAAFEVMSRTAGLNFVLDKDVKADSKITLFLRNSTIDEALRLILVTNQLERKMLNENSVLIYPNTAAKNKDYQETVTKSFYLVNTDVKQAQTLIKSMVKSKDIFIDEKLNLMVVKDTPDGVRLAERLLESLDLALPEVVLEVEVLEVSRTRLLNLGLDFPDQIGYGILQPGLPTTTIVNGVTQTTTTAGGALAAGNVDLRNRGNLTSYVTNPAVLLNLKKQDGDSKLLANPRIRVINREKAKIHIGDKLPVFTTTSTANVGVAASVNYLDVGLKLEVEPRVYLDEDVEMKVSLEVSSIVKEISGPSNSLAYQVGTRSVQTVLRLRDGETQVLAGLINDEERSSANRIPGLGDLPMLGRLFSAQTDSKNKTEIVLLITPRVVRNVARPELSMPAVASGTEASVGSAPLQIRSGSLRGTSSSRSGGGAPSGPDSGASASAPTAPPTPSAVSTEAVTLQLQAPAHGKPGQSVSISLSASSATASTGTAELVLDPAYFETPSVSITLLGGNGQLHGEASLKLRADSPVGGARLEVGLASAADLQGAVMQLKLPPAQVVQVAP